MKFVKLARYFHYKYSVDPNWDPDSTLFDEYRLTSDNDAFERFDEEEASKLDVLSPLEVFLDLSSKSDKLPEAAHIYLYQRVDEASDRELVELLNAFDSEGILKEGPLNDFEYLLEQEAIRRS